MDQATLTCPKCGHKQTSRVEENACTPFYVCDGCGETIRPKEGSCCVHCSHSDKACKKPE